MSLFVRIRPTSSASRIRQARALRLARQRSSSRQSSVAGRASESSPATVSPFDFKLTKREVDVALLITQSLSAKAIAGALGISVHTATRHTESIMRKMKVNSRVAVAAHMLRQSIKA